ncbi:MAG TPA: asparagine synthetase B, partial [Candidatus Binatia bacterium]|nr:asparagine synthetase B [Candidatus Binatia bacterium]
MCGISGIIYGDRNRPVSIDDVKRMCRTLTHRGPDDEGFFIRDNVGLGMRRLKVIDLVTGHQPISNEDGSIWIVFNGEIYNYPELRRELEHKG